MSKSNNLVNNWVFSSPDGEYAGILVNIPRSDVAQAALLALAEINPDVEYTEVKYTRYKGSTLVLAFKPDTDGIAEYMLSDYGTTQALYDVAGWPLDLGDDDGDADDGDADEDEDNTEGEE